MAGGQRQRAIPRTGPTKYLFIYLFIYLRTQHSKQYKIEGKPKRSNNVAWAWIKSGGAEVLVVKAPELRSRKFQAAWHP